VLGGRSASGRRQIDIDSFLIAHGRLFGLLVVTTLGYVWLAIRYGPQSCPQWLLLSVRAEIT